MARSRTGSHARRRRPVGRPLLLAVLVGSFMAVVATTAHLADHRPQAVSGDAAWSTVRANALLSRGGTSAEARAVSVRRPASPPPVRVLRRWDEARAAAYARGSAAELRSLYVPGSAAGASDVRMLRSYLARGYRVEEMRMQLLAVRVLARRPGEWRLEVTDRLASAVAVGPDRVPRPLPRDNASTRVVRLVRSGGAWLVAAVRG